MGALARLNLQAAPAAGVSEAQQQTQSAFSFKWQKRETYDGAAVQDAARTWLHQRYCGGDPALVGHWLSGGRKLILDAGCGAGLSGRLFFGPYLKDHDYLGVDISDAVDVARQRFAEAGLPGEFFRCDLMALPVPDGSFDLVFSEGVLHHTDNTEAAVKRLARLVAPGGRLMFYVYAKKSLVREFTDDALRESLKPLSDEAAWEALMPLTRLGKALGDLGITVEVPEDIPLLGIPKGPIDVQRLFYWHVCKAYYRPDWTLDEMNHVNFDWFRPLNCHRQTPDQVEAWVKDAGLTLESLRVEEAGITVVARRLP